jgi:hypothetical protein
MLTKESKVPLSVSDFTKTNGIMRELNGQKIYTMEFTTNMKVEKKCWHVGGFDYLASFSPMEAFDQNMSIYYTNKTFFNKGAIISMKGQITFEETDNGWRMLKNNVNDFNILSNSDPDLQTEIDSRNKSKNDSENLTLTFDSYSEGDYPHLLFVDNSSKKQYDFRSLNENNLCGIPILLDDNQSSFGFKANPEYLNKSFIVECKKNSIKGLDLEGNTIIDEVWIITNLKVK